MQPAGGCRVSLGFAGEGLGPRGVHRVRPAIGPDHPAGDQRRRPAGLTAACLEQRQQRAGLRHRVVVHDPDQVGSVGEGKGHAVGEPAGAAVVGA